jgi:hypothetical protein
MTVFWVVWDGAPEWIVRRLADSGDLPVLARLRREGIHAGLPATAPNCQTPTGLATLFTGMEPPEHGVTGFWVPGGPSGLKGQRRAFDPGVLRRPPAWDLVPGLRAVFLHVPWARAAGGSASAAALAAVEAFNTRASREDFLELGNGQDTGWRRGGTTFRVSRDRDGRYTIGGSDGSATVSDAWIAIGPAGEREWFRRVGDRVISTARFEPQVAGRDSRLRGRLTDALAMAGPFAGEALGSLYRAGALGVPCSVGGDGSAEGRLLDGVDLVLRPFTATVRAVGDAVRPGDLDLFVLYVPVSDDVGHEILGPATSGNPAHEPAAEVLRATYRRLDALLGELLECAAPGDTVIVCADHGMTPADRTCYVNNVLVRAGLAEPAANLADGADVGSSRAWYHLVNNGLLLANHHSLPGGFLDDDAAAHALAAAMTALTESRGQDGQPVVSGFCDEHGRPVSAPLRGRWSVYALFADGCMPWPDCTPGGEPVGAPLRSGAHHTNNGDSRLRAAFTAARLPGARLASRAPLRQPAALSEVAGLVTACMSRDRHHQEMTA